MTLREYLDAVRHKTVAVVGIGVSNEPLIRLLLQEGVAVTACDKRTREQLGKLAGELEARGARLQLGPDYLEGLDQDIIFRTPGLRPDVPQLAKAVAGGSELTSEMEVFFRVCPCPIIAVTGSDGKTTTTTIIAELLKKAGNTVHVGGNIGHPLLCEAGDMRPTDYAVLELSSFQLMTMPYSPHIAVVTNLAPNHLDVHKDMAEYVAAKENIFRHQKPGDKAIFNFDNDITRQQGESVPDRAVYFSRQSEPEKGVFLRGDAIVCRGGAGERTVMTTADIKLPGVHNVENYMAAVAACGGQVLVRGIIPKHMDCITAKLQEMGVQVEEQDDTLLVRRSGKLHRANVKTLPYPGFPTDMQPQITVALCLAEGTSMVTEGVWDNRYRYVGELTRMGAQIRVEGRSAVVEGVDHLNAASVQAYDLRAGAAMVIAALAAEGTSEVSNVHYIERGYEDIIEKLRSIGAQIESVECEEVVETRQIG